MKVKQGDGSNLGGNFVVYTAFKVWASNLVLDQFAIYAEVLDISNRDIILCLSWLTENRFSVDTRDRCLSYINTGKLIPGSLI